MRNCYTYLIGWLHLNIFYYGVRYAIGCDPSDLWVKYFTSSKEVKKFREEHGEPNLVQIRKIFGNDIEKAKLWESRVLTKFKVATNDKFLNKIETYPNFGNTAGPFRGRKHTDEAKQKIKEFYKDKDKSAEARRKLAEKRKGIKVPPMSRNTLVKKRNNNFGRQSNSGLKNREHFKGRPISEEQKQKTRETLLIFYREPEKRKQLELSVIESYNNGLCSREISNIVGLSKRAVLKIINRYRTT